MVRRHAPRRAEPEAYAPSARPHAFAQQSPAAAVLALQRSAGNAAVQQWLAASRPPVGARVMRIQVKSLDANGKPIEFETDDKTFAELADIAMHPKNRGNAELQLEFQARANRCTPGDIITLLEAFLLMKLFSDRSPLQDKSRLEAALGELITDVERECKTEQEVVARIGAAAALQLAMAWKGHTTRFPKLVATAKGGLVEQKERKREAELKEEREREDRRVQRTANYIRLLAKNMVDFLGILLAHDFPDDAIAAQLSSLDAWADILILMHHTPATVDLADLATVANGFATEVNVIIATFEKTLGGLERSPFDEPLYGEYDYEVEQRRRQVEKILAAHLPSIVAALNRDGRENVRLLYRGSLTDALKNATKSTTLGNLALVRVLNLHEFDADAFIEITDETWAYWLQQQLLPKGLFGDKIGLRQLHGYLKWYETHQPGADDKARWDAALDLRARIGLVLAIEELIGQELREIEGYKRQEPEKDLVSSGKAEKGSVSSSSKPEKSKLGSKAKNDLPADFGFVLQPAATTRGQAQTGKTYALGLLTGLGLRVLELRSQVVVDAARGALNVRLPEPVETIEPGMRTGPRPRAYTV